MSGRDSSTGNNDWTRFWAQAQEQAWESWQALIAQQSLDTDSNPDRLWRIWSDGLEQLWRGRASRLDGTHQEVFTRLLDQGKGFFFLSHQMLQAFEQMQHGAASGDDWQPVLRRYINRAQEQLRQWAGVSTGQAAFWGLPAEMWERLAGAFNLTPGDWTQALKNAGWGASGTGEQSADRVREWPALGVTRDWQLRMQEGAHRSEACREAWQVYGAKLVEVGVLALEYLYERLVAAGERGKPLADLRQLYDLWVECAEQAYAEVVISREFAQAQAEVVNTVVAFKQHLQETQERVAAANNLPTRRELDAAHRAIRAMREEIASLRAELNRRAPAKKKVRKKARTKAGGA